MGLMDFSRAGYKRGVNGEVVATAREVLNALRWRGDRDLGAARIEYADRVRPEGVRIIEGSEIVALERRYFTTAAARLPYYKVLRIRYGPEVLFERPRARPRGARPTTRVR